MEYTVSVGLDDDGGTTISSAMSIFAVAEGEVDCRPFTFESIWETARE
jgi:hypothetical protein